MTSMDVFDRSAVRPNGATDTDGGPADPASLGATTPPPASTPPPAFPPPTPAELAGGRRSRLPIVLAAFALVVAAVMTVLWLGARSDASDADADAAAAEQRADALAGDVDVAQTAAADLEQANTDLRAELDAARAELDQAQDTELALEAANADNETLSADLDAAVAVNADLQAQLEAALAELEAVVGAQSPEADPAQPAGADVTDTPEFARWVGELLSSRTGSSRLGADASICFGTEVIAVAGLDALGAGQHNAASGADRQVVIDAMVAAAATCGIDQSLIFG